MRARSLLSAASLVLLLFAIARTCNAEEGPLVEVELTMGGGMGEGVPRPPPQHLRVPRHFLTPPGLADVQGVINSSAVALQLPFHSLRPGSAPLILSAVASITADRWPERMRGYFQAVLTGGPEVKSHVEKHASLGLDQLVYDDPAWQQYSFDSLYTTEDPALGLVYVKCMKPVAPGPKSCRVQTALARNLLVSVQLPETELSHWRERAVAVRSMVESFIVPMP